MTFTVLYPEKLYADDSVERRIFGPEVNVVVRDTKELRELSDTDCAAADGLMILRQSVQAPDLARFTRLRAVVRMGVGYDKIDRRAAAARQVVVCNVPDYGTTEVADHAIALAMALRRGLLLHHEWQRGPQRRAVESGVRPADPPHRRADLRHHRPGPHRHRGGAARQGAGLPGDLLRSLPPERRRTRDRRRTRTDAWKICCARRDTLSIHAPLTPETTGMIGARELALLPKGAVVVNTARGPIIDIDALAQALKSGHLAGVGLDVVPVEPPVEPVPELIRAYRAREPWTEGRLIITPHSAFHTPEAWDDIRTKGAETMRAFIQGRPQNVIAPEDF